MSSGSAALLLIASWVSAQTAIPVPTDHYGPPACGDVHSALHRQTVESAVAEQERGAVLDHALPSAEPMENFAFARYRIAEYGDCVQASNCYWADLDAQYRRAELALGSEIAMHKPGEKLAIVMDIDETSLSNYCEMKHEDFGYIGGLSNPWVLSPESAVAIPGALRLYKEARAAGIAVFFITGRPGTPRNATITPWVDQTSATARNLETAGYHDWAALQLRNGAENDMPTIEYKSSERKRISDRGYRIILSVGDQWSDLLGTHQAEVDVKLPNPFYFIP